MKNGFIPSDYQKKIFDWITNGKGNAIVNAVAGAGKTTTLVEATRRIEGRRSLFAAFNKHIVTTLKRRLHPSITCKTIHAIGYACLLTRFGTKKIDPKEFKYRALCRGVANEISKELEQEYEMKLRVWLKQTDKRTDEPTAPPSAEEIQDQLLEIIDLSRCTLVDVTNIDQLFKMVIHFAVSCPLKLEYILPALERIISLGEQLALERHEVDFTDMIWLPYRWGLKPSRYDWVFVDEAQDLNPAQLHLIMKTMGPYTRMLFVGDPKQAIYGFSGADVNSFYNIKKLTEAYEFPLSICYRCPKKVVALAKTIVPVIVHKDDAMEGEIETMVEDRIASYIKEGDLILCRKTEPLVKLCLHLIGNRIQAFVRGKDIGKQLVVIIKEIAKTRGFSFHAFWEYLDEYRELRISKLRSKPDTEREIIDFLDQMASIETCYMAFNVRTLKDFISEIEKLFSDERAAVTLSTIHRAKGLEEERVFVLYYEQLPLVWDGQREWQLDQEKNLKYVAITRAKQKLYLVAQKSEVKEQPVLLV